MKLAIIMAIHYTHGWTQRFLQSYMKHIDQDLIVFDNNPVAEQYIKKTRGNRGESESWNQMCQEESAYVRNLERTTVIDVPRPTESTYELPTHGDVLDFAFQWCKNEKYESILHIEPDCHVTGHNWLNQMIEAINDNWAVGKGIIHRNGPFVIPLCPTLWRIQETLDLGITFNRHKPDINTAQKTLRECEKAGKLVAIRTNEFIHYGNGTKKQPYLMP